MTVDMSRVLALWLHDHPGGTEEDFNRAGRPFNAERGSRHRRVHSQFLDWLNMEHVQRAILSKQT
jgi:hypothetical protein